MVFATKSLGARRADERSFVGVCSDVYLEVVRLGELTLAEAANVLRRAGSSPHSTAVSPNSRLHDVVIVIIIIIIFFITKLADATYYMC